MSEEKKDRILVSWIPSFSWLPGVLVLKSGQRGRWTVIFSWITNEFSSITDETDDCYFIYWLQFRAWWPPVFFYRGWVKRDE